MKKKETNQDFSRQGRLKEKVNPSVFPSYGQMLSENAITMPSEHKTDTAGPFLSTYALHSSLLDRSYDVISAKLAHQFKHDLLFISRQVENLVDSGDAEKKVRQIVKHIQSRVEKLNEMVNWKDNATECDFNYIIKRVTQAFSKEIRYLKIDVRFSLSANIPQLLLNEGDIHEIVYNLISNAISAINESKNVNPMITLITEVIEINHIKYLQISIFDNGIDIKENQQLFQRGNSTWGRTGMGLWISKEIVNAIGGNITATLKDENQKVFEVRIPIKRYLK